MSNVDHPLHYGRHGSGIECIDVVEWMGFSLGNDIEDLEKARWYLEREIERRKKCSTSQLPPPS